MTRFSCICIRHEPMICDMVFYIPGQRVVCDTHIILAPFIVELCI